MFWLGTSRGTGRRRKLLALLLILALVPACPWNPAQIYIPGAYALTGLCIALLVSPTPAAAVIGLVVGGLLGAAVYNNSLKHQIKESQKTPPAPGK
jgi:hypothetical protein